MPCKHLSLLTTILIWAHHLETAINCLYVVKHLFKYR